jgi:protein-export SecD/SecF family membrane protein
MKKHRFLSVVLIIVLIAVGYFIYASQTNKTGFFSGFAFKYGLDLAGGTQLTYKADVSQISPADVGDAMSTLRDVIERRVNLFGVSEPVVQVLGGGAGSSIDHKLVVDLPGVTDVNKAIALIGQTPVLEFRLVKADATSTVTFANTLATGLTGRYVSHAAVAFTTTGVGQAVVNLTFNSDGAALFSSTTKNNVGRQLAIFLDGEPLSAPTIREQITDGNAQISGNFTPQAAKDLVRNLNYGALPVPVELVGTQSVGASLGQQALAATAKAGVIGFIVIALFLILWYRLPGLLATVSLLIYVALSLLVFKLIPVTLTSAGFAGFILSIGMAVDANILIFERMREEMLRGLSVADAIKEGFARAWFSIRDSNLSSIITAIVLYYFSSTAVIKGFALVFGLGVLISMFTAITVSRTFLMALGNLHNAKISKFLFHNGFKSSSASLNSK